MRSSIRELTQAGQLVARARQPQTPDEGYGGGHNNDNATVSVCIETYVAATAS